MFDREGLIKYIRDRFKLNWAGLHGTPHWARVRDNGLRLCEHHEEADPLVVEIFAWVHDIERTNDGPDPEHGPSAAKLIVEELLGTYFELNDQQAEDLIIAVRDHSKGETEGTATVRVCWDADRLDLGRFGTLPDPARLCTIYGKTAEMIRWAQARALAGEYGFVDNDNIKY